MNDSHRQMDGSILTYTGKRFYPLNPKKEDIDVLDIAHHLSNQCRYTGATKFHYSVATHSVLMYDYIKGLGADIITLCCVILHDSSESWLVDLPAPLKHEVGGFGKLFIEAEDRIDAVVAERFGLPYPWPPIVKEIDIRIRSNELTQLFPGHEVWHDLADPLPLVIPEWTPTEGKAQFLWRLEELGLVNLTGQYIERLAYV